MIHEPCGPAAGARDGEEHAPAISAEVRASHADLSAVSASFLEHALGHPELARRVDYRFEASVPGWMREYQFFTQPLPFFVDERKRRQLARATAGLVELVKSVPERLLGGDARRIAARYGLRDERLAALLLSPPSGIAASFARADLVDDGEELKCLELNVSGSLGGWENRFLERICRCRPGVADFLAGAGVEARYRDPWLGALTHVLACAEPRWRDGAGRCNVAVALGRQSAGWERLTGAMDDFFQEVLRGRGEGRLVGCAYPNDLVARGGELFHGQLRIGAVIELTTMPTPRDVYRCFKAGSVGLFNGPISALLSNKGNLALLSQHEESDLLSGEERELVRRHVPWSRLVADERTTFHGERIDLLAFAAARRESLVLKPVAGYQGMGVHLGSLTPAARWRRHLDEAAGTGKVLLQEYVRPRPYLCQDGEQGWAPHQGIWGTFDFGGNYGGTFLRLMPLASGPTVINASLGAAEGLVYEV